MKNPVNMVAVAGLAVGGVFGMIGTFVAQRNLQAAAWGLDGVALVVATALLAMKFFRKGNDLAAAGFIVFAIGEGIILVGTAMPLAESGPSFAAAQLCGLLPLYSRAFPGSSRVGHVSWA